ncbi:MAG: bifunctional ADP-dependent NAD(P)H-hydrate dehydratase/NAD(P)H-hydrate epimerase [Curvibacter lanceolatus]|uniref:bifunctional ADP-dependent NAD(P)H-hydrate dehydratase/NAD(P)H-hydrate epimerase n=1 Tax=Curvibacter lanceolatus TaxID=86182 RepID=UPI000375990A|nr:bifunctional ADP-dependent NAD(P)H-hydrate dehydratase/NAD(P)H-hydrate epimerase [Curvibacter lanceolatus]MBV5296390.1 bifunctional ADP-dependent NAD(P)H-hydrate dehydratase/NAD(P)H-hydrate epimerase [Curvibacter lanceolatus]
MDRIHPDRAHPLHMLTSTRALEAAWLQQLPAHTLMQRAGQALARLAQALAPHAQTIWVACGSGNNGGDGWEAAYHLQLQGFKPVVTWLGQPGRCSADTLTSRQAALRAGVICQDQPPELGQDDLCIDALLGIGLTQQAERPAPPLADTRLTDWIERINCSRAQVLAADIPSGLSADQGTPALTAGAVRADHTLSLLTLKPGLFTAQGRDHAGTVWLDTLGVPLQATPADAWLSPPPTPRIQAFGSHKGSYGDVQVLGGEGLNQRGLGMTGAALLAGRAALHAGAGRVLVGLLDTDEARLSVDMAQPELMLRTPEALSLKNGVLVCGCGGGDAIERWVPKALAEAPCLLLDADALNALARHPDWMSQLATRRQRGWDTVLTPHPLEAARLLDTTAAAVQSDRLAAAQALAARTDAVVVLKGSGTVISQTDQTPHINPTGNAHLATAGTGDVLAGLIGALWARPGMQAFDAAREGVFVHGSVADQWPAHQAFTAGTLASALRRQ